MIRQRNWHGLPAGSGIRFSDPVTLGNALRGRQGL